MEKKTLAEIIVASHLISEQQRLNQKLEDLEKPKKVTEHISNEQFWKNHRYYMFESNLMILFFGSILGFLIYLKFWG